MRTKEKIMQDIADEDFYKERVIYRCICEVLIDIRDTLNSLKEECSE